MECASFALDRLLHCRLNTGRLSPPHATRPAHKITPNSTSARSKSPNNCNALDTAARLMLNGFRAVHGSRNGRKALSRITNTQPHVHCVLIKYAPHTAYNP